MRLFVAAAAVGVLLAAVGCDKLTGSKTAATTAATQSDTVVTPGPGGGVVVSGGGGGGGGGTLSAVRKAADRTQVRAALADLRLTIENFEVTNGKMPTPQETLAMVRQAAPKYAKLIDDGDVVLNAARTRESVWAYEGRPPYGTYLVLTNQGVEEMDAQALKQRLGQ